MSENEKSVKAEKKKTQKSVSHDLKMARQSNATRLERIAKMQNEIELENERIKELEDVVNSLYISELTEKLTRQTVIKKTILSDTQISTLVDLTKIIVENINTLDKKAVEDVISSSNGRINKPKQPKSEKTASKVAEDEETTLPSNIETEVTEDIENAENAVPLFEPQ
jgi:hypothetical protein